MDNKIPNLLSSLAPTFETTRNQFSCLNSEAARLHDAIQVCDEPSRAAFNALSRIQAFSDQIDLILALMKEDIQVVEELADSEAAIWTEPFGDTFQQWLKSPRSASMKVN